MKQLTRKVAIIGSSILLAGTVGTITGLVISQKETSNNAVLLVKQDQQVSRAVEIAKPEAEQQENSQQENNNEAISAVDGQKKDKTQTIFWVLGTSAVVLILLAACIVMAKKIKSMDKNITYN